MAQSFQRTQRRRSVDDDRSKSHPVPERPAQREDVEVASGPGSTARVRFLRKTYQQTRQFIGEDLEASSSEDDESNDGRGDGDVVAKTVSSDGPHGRRLSTFAQTLSRKEYLWKKVQAVAAGTRRALQQRNQRLTQLKTSLQEFVEQQKVAKQIQDSLLEGEDLLSGLRSSLDNGSMEMLEEIATEAMKFKVLQIPDFLQKILDYALGAEANATTNLLGDSLLEAMQDAVELGEDWFEMDELRTSILDKVEAFRLAMRKASKSRIDGKLKSLMLSEVESGAKATPFKAEEIPQIDSSVEEGVQLNHGLLVQSANPGEATAESLEVHQAKETQRVPPLELEPPRGFEKAKDMDEESLNEGACTSSSTSTAEPDNETLLGAVGCSSEMSSPRSPATKVSDQPISNNPWAALPSDSPQGAEIARGDLGEDPIASSASVNASSIESMCRTTWHGKLVVLGPCTCERMASKPASKAAAGNCDRFPALPIYRNASKEAASVRRPEFRALKQKAASLDSGVLPMLGVGQRLCSASKGSGRFGYTLPDTPRRPNGPVPMLSPRRNPPSHPAPRQMAWTLLPGILATETQ